MSISFSGLKAGWMLTASAEKLPRATARFGASYYKKYGQPEVRTVRKNGKIVYIAII